jgi:acetyl esterase/lipase
MNSKHIYIIACILFFGNSDSIAQEVYNLWDESNIPYYKENSLAEYEQEIWGTICVYNITKPTLTVYRPTKINTGKAVIIIPGGGYELVALYHEGHDIAKILAKDGITAAVLKYRLPDPESSDQPQHVPFSDGRRALELLHQMAPIYKIDTSAIGVLGFSAGSHLSTALSLWQPMQSSQKPDFSALIYGVTRFNEENQKWLEESLYFRPMDSLEIKQHTLLDQVTSSTPPAFLVHAIDDAVCHYTESKLYAEKLLANNIPVEVHLFPKGGHGFGLGREEDGTNQWITLFINWLNRSSF